MPRSVPAMLKRPRTNSTSAAAASKKCAAACLPCSITRSLAATDAKLIHRYAEDATQQVALSKNALAAQAKDQPIVRRIVFSNGGARFHRTHDDAVVGER